MTARRTRLLLSAALSGGLLMMAGCEAPAPESEDNDVTVETRNATVTSAFETAGRSEALIFLPNEDAPWTGLLASSLTGGGFDIYNIDGEAIISAAGPELRGLAGVSDFALRGETFPLLFGVDDMGQLRSFVIVRETREVIELPLESEEPLPTAAGVCLFDQGIGYVELAVLAEGAEARIVRVRDAGGTGLTLEERNTRTLPFPARSCAAAEDDLLVAGPTAGLARITPTDQQTAFAAGLSVTDVSYTELMGRPVALVASSQTGLVSVYDAASLELIVDVQFEDGLSAPAFERPSALAVTEANYGGMAFSSGIMAVYDAADSSVKLVAREVLSRTVVSGDEA